MTPYDLKWKKKALKKLDKLEKEQKQRIRKKLEWFSQHPNRSKNIKYIEKYDCLRYRIGNFRIYFEKDQNEEIIRILNIDKRPQAYR